jgi:hypothetical protein
VTTTRDPAIEPVEANESIRASGRRRLWLLGLPVVLLVSKAAAVLARVVAPNPTLTETEAIVEVALAIMAIVAAVSLLAGRRLGWILALSIVGWDLAASLVLWWVEAPNYLSMGLLALVAFLITSPDVRALYRSQPDR